MLESSFRAALDDAGNEQKIQTFLRKNVVIIRNALNAWAWNYVDVLPEFRLGSDYRVDYLIVSAHSGAWHVVFVELKSPRARLFTAKGLPSEALNTVLRQLDDWSRWVNRHESLLRETLARHLARDQIPSMCSPLDLHTTAETEIRDPRTVLYKEFHVVIGRREDLRQEDQERRGTYHERGYDIVTFDRLLDVARKLDEAGKTV